MEGGMEGEKGGKSKGRNSRNTKTQEQKLKTQWNHKETP